MRLNILLFCLITLFSCQSKQSRFEISANLNGFKNGSKVVISDDLSQKVLDSTLIMDGKFIFEGFLEDAPTFVNLIISSDDGLDRNYASIFMGNEKIAISGDKSSFNKEFKVSGSQYHGFKAEFDKQVNPLNKERKEKLQQMFTLRNEGK